MKRLLIAIAAAATTMFASAEVLESEDFESSSWTGVTATPYGKEETPAALQYPFTATNATYGVLDDDASSPEAEGATCFDMYVQFTAMTEAPSFPTEAKIAVYADAYYNIHVLTTNGNYTTEGTVDADTWARLTIVAESNGYKVYVNDDSPILGTLEGSEDSVSVFPAETGAKTVEFTGSGKLDNFVARTTDPFSGAPDGWIAKEGNDPDQYYTDYTAVLTAALNGASLTYSAGNEMDGSAAHPFEIRSADDLKALAAAVNAGKSADKCFVQTANIDMADAGAFAGIGVYNVTPTAGTPFTGTYDGGGFKISNVTMTARNYGGVFNQVVGGTVKNLTVENINVASGASGEYGYAIVGHAANGATLQNLTAAGSFLSSDKPGTHNMAGIVVRVCGGADSATVTTIANCTNNAAIYGAYTKLGGICAIAQTQTGFTAGSVLFQNCANTGALTSSYNSTKATGFAGILAYSAANTVLDGCTNTGTLSNTSETANTDVNGRLVGTVQNNTLKLKSAVASGDIGKFNAGCTVALDFNVSGNNVDFNLYGATGSTVELLQDFTGGYPVIGSSIAPALKLSANMTINNGNKNSTNATFAVVTGTGNLTMSNAQATRWYVITKLQNYSGVISAGSYEKVAFGDIVSEAGYGTALVKAGSNFNVDALASTKVNGAAANLCVDTLNNQKGIYLVAAQVVADDESTTGYASVENALAAADAAYASTVNVLDANAEEVAAADWSYANGVYTSTRAIATLKGTNYTSLAKALAAAQDGDTVTLVAATSEAVTIPAGVTVAVTDDVAFSGKLSGAGAIKYTKVPQKFPASTLVAGEWTGTFIIAYNQETSANIAFNSYGISGSYVEIAEGCSLTGHCMGGTLATLVVNGTLNIVDGSTVTTATIYALAGSGNVSVTQNRKYTFSNLVDWNGTLTSNGNLISIGNVTSGAGSIEYLTTPAVAPTVGEDFEGEVYLNFNYSNYDVYKYAGTNATVRLGTMTGHLHDGAGTSGQTGEIPGKTVVAGAVAINNGWPIGSANWTAAKVVKFDSLKVDGSLTLDATTSDFGTARCYYYAKSLDAAGIGTITVGDGFGLRIDAVDFAEAPSGSDVLVRLTLDTADLLTTDGQLFGTGGTLNGSIAVTVNGEATEQTLVYDADKGGLVLYVAPTPVAIDPSDVVINYNCYATLSVTGYPEGATFGWTMYTNGVACSSLSGPVKISSGKNKATVKVYSETTAFDNVVAKVAITNGEDVIEREATITVADVAAKIGETEYTKAQLDNAIAAAIASGEVLEHYLGVSATISKGQTLKTKKLAGRNGSATVKAAASTTAGEAWAISKSAEDEDGVITWSVETETPIFEFTSADSQTVEYLASPKNAAGVNKLLSDATITKQFSVTKDGVVLDLNGHALTSTYASASAGAFYVNVISPAPAALTVKDSVGGGSIAAASAHSVFMLGNNGQLTVEGGSFTGKHIVYGSKTTSAATITGGTFTATDAGFTLNMLDSARGTITVTGGTFTGFNPANNSAEGAGTNFVPNGYVSTETSTGVWTVSKSASGFPGGEDGKTFTIDTAVQAALAEKIPEGKALTDAVAGTTSGVTYAQAYALGLLDEKTGDVEKDVTPTIEIVDGKVVVSLDATAKAGYKVMLNVYEKSSLTDEWLAEPTTSYELGSETEAAGFEPSKAGAGFYKVGVTIEDAE